MRTDKLGKVSKLISSCLASYRFEVLTGEAAVAPGWHRKATMPVHARPWEKRPSDVSKPRPSGERLPLTELSDGLFPVTSLKRLPRAVACTNMTCFIPLSMHFSLIPPSFSLLFEDTDIQQLSYPPSLLHPPSFQGVSVDPWFSSSFCYCAETNSYHTCQRRKYKSNTAKKWSERSKKADKSIQTSVHTAVCVLFASCFVSGNPF